MKKTRSLNNLAIPFQCLAALAAINLASCASESDPQGSEALELIEEELVEEAAEASGPDRAAIAALAYRDQVQWLDPAVRQRMDDATLENILDYLEDQIPSQEVVATVRHESDTIDCIPWASQKSVRNLRAAGIAVDEQLVAPRTLVEQESQASKEEALDPNAVESEQPPIGKDSVAPFQAPLCPKGTVAMRRTPLSEVAAYGSVEGYIKRPPPATQLHEHVAVEKNTKNYGNEGFINTWKPSVPTTGDFSLVQFWTKRGTGANLETVELGVIRWGGDTDTRLFIFTTNANYDPTIANSICWNADCGAFVQTDNTFALSQAMTPYSVSNGSQYSTFYKLQKDGDSGHWWVAVADKWVGYWPRTWFDSNGIRNYAATVQWGAEVYDDSGPHHTTADIGSGGYAAEGFGRAAYIRRMRYLTDVTGGVIYWSEASGTSWVGSHDTRCYTGLSGLSTDANWKYYLYAGGEGYNWFTGGDPAVLCRF